MEEYHVLHLEANLEDVALIKKRLKADGLGVVIHTANDEDTFRDALESQEYDVILSDNSIPNFDSRHALSLCNELNIKTPFIVVTGTMRDVDALNLLQKGAIDYLYKDDILKLSSTIERSINDARLKLQHEEQALIHKEIVDQTQAGLFKLNEEGCFTYSNEYLSTILEKQVSQILNHSLIEFINEASASELKKFFKSQKREFTLECELSSAIKGTFRWVKLHISRVDQNLVSGKSFIGSMFDITQLKDTEEKLEDLARYDVVTGLPNRTFLQEMIKNTLLRAKRKNKSFAVLFIDVDNFKHINDSYGHSLGDKLLKELSQRIRHTARDSDYVARIGGDEFVVVADDIDTSTVAADIASRLIQALHKDVNVENILLRATVSIGISVYPEGGDTTEELLKHADAAMYKAKAQGKNNYQFYTSSLNDENTRRLLIDTHLRNAIKNNELSLMYQPQFSLITKKVEGMEALLRWNSPFLGNVPPDEFIPIAEAIGMIYDIGDWVINEAFNQFSIWHERHPELTISLNVNCSTSQLQKQSFINYVQNQIDSHDFGGSNVILEATETMLMEHVEVAKTQLGKLNSMGIKFAIDDFGTGYSSLNYLKQLPISILKIDKSFVKDIPHDQNDVAIVKAVIQLAKALNLEVIAEGVETEEQAKYLIELGCKSAQGFWFAVPLTSEEFSTFLDEQMD